MEAPRRFSRLFLFVLGRFSRTCLVRLVAGTQKLATSICLDEQTQVSKRVSRFLRRCSRAWVAWSGTSNHLLLSCLRHLWQRNGAERTSTWNCAICLHHIWEQGSASATHEAASRLRCWDIRLGPCRLRQLIRGPHPPTDSRLAAANVASDLSVPLRKTDPQEGRHVGPFVTGIC